jgi:hypothetical protein
MGRIMRAYLDDIPILKWRAFVRCVVLCRRKGKEKEG